MGKIASLIMEKQGIRKGLVRNLEVPDVKMYHHMNAKNVDGFLNSGKKLTSPLESAYNGSLKSLENGNNTRDNPIRGHADHLTPIRNFSKANLINGNTVDFDNLNKNYHDKQTYADDPKYRNMISGWAEKDFGTIADEQKNNKVNDRSSLGSPASSMLREGSAHKNPETISYSLGKPYND